MVVIAALTSLGSCSATSAVSEHVDETAGAALPLGQPAPGDDPVLFAPGIVNTDAIELNGVLSPGGDEFFFTRRIDDVFIMYRSTRVGGDWSEPHTVQPYPAGERATAVDMAYSTDGDELFFLGRGSTDQVQDESGLNLWVMKRHGDSWSEARLVPPPVSSEWRESYPCVVADGSLYFSSRRPGGLGSSDIYRAQRRPDGSFAEPVNLGAPINTKASEGDTYVAPDESCLIVTSRREGGFGGGDLYISFKRAGGGWTTPENLGPRINTEQVDFCPMMTPDGRYLFFSRRWGATWDETTRCEVFWIDATVLEPFRR